jgi:endonuclease-3 related protein
LTLIEIYETLLQFFGKQYWWPADTQDEIIIGAILTQNTAWQNVEKAIGNLKKANLCSLQEIRNTPQSIIEDLIKTSGFYRQKSLYLKEIASFFKDFNESTDTVNFRKALLNVKGIGLETADSILLYAFSKPVFVVDAYTKRLVERHKLFYSKDYNKLAQFFFMKNLPNDVELFKDYHALIVKLGKTFCRKKPNCKECPLKCV